MIIGLTGSLASGKGVVSDFFKKQGFVYLSLSDELREIVKEKKISVTRENLINEGNKLRNERGAGVLGELVREKIENQQFRKAIVDGIRNPAEIKELQKIADFFLVCVDAPREIRFERMKERNRESDPVTWEEFLKIDEKDRGEADEKGQQVRKCMEMADFMIFNDSTLEEAEEKVRKLYDKIVLAIPRPSWDEYFIKMAALVAERSTCLRHHIGAVIVKNKRVLSTGYNGAARGMRDCTEIGCIKDEKGLASGTGYEICRAIHAEQNAILQGAIHGISLDGATLYCTHSPCMLCAKEIVQAGIKEVVSYHDFQGDLGARNFLANSGVLIRKVPRPFPFIDFKD
jgi:dCMP deaminase